MYYCDGLIFRIFASGGIFLLLGIIVLFLEKPWKNGWKKQNNWISIALIVIALIITTNSICGIIDVKSGDVSSCTGVFESRGGVFKGPLLTQKYVFRKNGETAEVLYLDTISRKKIIPFELEEGKTYTVYYEAKTSIIVKVEEVN